MEVTRQLRVDRVTKTGLAPIMLTCWWDNQRLRLMPGEKCLPEPLQHLFGYLVTPSYFSAHENQPKIYLS